MGLFLPTAMKENSSGSASRNLLGVHNDTFDVQERRLDHTHSPAATAP